MDLAPITQALRETFSQRNLFSAAYVNDRQYLSMYRLHARVCGLLARIGTNLGFVVDIGRRYPIDPILGRNGRQQRQAEADISFVDQQSGTPIALLDYETSDAPLREMRQKFRYLSTFAKHSPSVELLGFFITVTKVRHGWDKESHDDRELFAREEIFTLIREVCEASHNAELTFMLGIFGPNQLRLRAFRQATEILDDGILYALASETFETVNPLR
ncbi:MAG: hypothetical protein WD738_15330 [Pirellulales bacterium]